jgi:uncharacterized membrane protein YphA (DoxX/SURF4 family)
VNHRRRRTPRAAPPEYTYTNLKKGGFSFLNLIHPNVVTGKTIAMIKTVLVILLGVFFFLNGINHWYNTDLMKSYAARKGLLSPLLMVRLSGLLLILGGLSMITGYLIIYGIIGLCLFLVLAAFTMHKFWAEKERNKRLNESMHFTKNLAILTELIYLAVS